MKVLFNHILPFSLAHGGAQIQIEQTKASLERAGVEVEFLRWWDASQRGDILHYFGPPSAAHADLVRQKGMKLVVTQLLGGLGVRPRLEARPAENHHRRGISNIARRHASTHGLERLATGRCLHRHH